MHSSKTSHHIKKNTNRNSCLFNEKGTNSADKIECTKSIDLLTFMSFSNDGFVKFEF